MLTILAIIPGVILMVYAYKLDKIEKEPAGLLLLLFICGALSVIPTVIVELLAESVVNGMFTPSSFLYMFVENFFAIALVEEGFKFLFTYIVAWRNKAFNYRFDAIVYAICVSMGFAIVENVLYVMEGGLSTAILRAIMSVPGHCIFALFMGYYMGQAKMQEKMHNSKKGKSLRLAIIVPVLLHGSYDFLASSGSSILSIVFLIFVLAIEVNAFIKIRKFAKEDMPMPY